MSRACHPEVYRAAKILPGERPWIVWCYNHEPRAGRDNSWRGVLAHCPTWQEALNLALAHATYERLRL